MWFTPSYSRIIKAAARVLAQLERYSMELAKKADSLKQQALRVESEAKATTHTITKLKEIFISSTEDPLEGQPPLADDNKVALY